jgi:hypothetical protein
VEVVDFADLAEVRIAALCQMRRYNDVSLTFIANPSAAWRDAMNEELASKARCKAERQQSRHEAYRTARHEAKIEPQPQMEDPTCWQLYPPSHNDLLMAGSYVQALHTCVFDLLMQAFEHKGISCKQATQHTIHAFLRRRIRGEQCSPWGCMWTVKRCLLLVPRDAASRYELTCWVGWQWGQAYCLWFDGIHLRECTYELLKQLLA